MTASMTIALRVAACVFGGYAIASGFVTAVAALVPPPRAGVLLGAILFSFAIHAAAVIWAFAARSPVRAAAAIVLIAAVLNGVGWFGGPLR